MKQLFILLFISLFIGSCKKKSCSEETITLDTQHDTVVVGWPVSLKTDYISTTVSNQWSGPNNWSLKTKNGISEIKLTSEALFTDAGNYLVESYSYDNCFIQKKNIQLHIIDPPPAPCLINVNSCSISSPIVYNKNYTQVTSSISEGKLIIKALNGPESIQFKFNTDEQEPKLGIHTGLQVSITTNVAPDYPAYRIDSDQKVYVRKVNGQVEISFCNAVFFNPSHIETDVIISGRIIVP